jgi:hypothetical protein
MFFIIWGHKRRQTTLGFVGPYSCVSCNWPGTFWLTAIESRFHLYYIPIGKWQATSHATVCRNCGHATAVTREYLQTVLAQVQPMTQPDMFGPTPSTGAPAAAPRPAVTWAAEPD